MAAQYPLLEGSIERPDGWADHTVNTFVFDSSGVTASFVVSRATPPAGVSFKDFAAAELHRMAHALKDYKLVYRGGIEIAGQVTDLIETQWTSQHGRVDQLLAYLPSGERLLILTGTSPAPIPPGVRQQILHMMTSFQHANA